MALASWRSRVSWSRSARRPARMSVSDSGWRRRVSEKRRSRMSSPASRNSTSSECPACADVRQDRRRVLQELAAARVDTSAGAVDLRPASTAARRTWAAAAAAGCRRSSSRGPRAPAAPSTCPRPRRRSRPPASFDVVPPAPLARVGQRAVEPLLELARRVVAAHLQQPVARRDLDERADVAARADRHAQQRHRHVEDRVDQLVEAEPVVLSFSSQRTSSITSSIFFSSRTAATPNRSLMLMMPRPRTSMWCLMSSEAQPKSTSPEVRRTSTRSSATSRWPRMTRSSAASDLPMPLLPSSRMPTPSTSISTPWMLAVGASCSSRCFWMASMAADDISGVRSTARRALGDVEQQARHLEPLGHHDAGRVEADERVDRAARLVVGSVPRYEISVAPRTCTRSGCTCRT